MKRFLLLALALGLTLGASADTEMQIRNGKLTTDLNANNFKIINLQLPISPNDAANKAYVDSVAAGGGGGGGGAGLPIMAGQNGKFLSTDGTIALWSLVPWTALTGTPTSLLGYGITDPIVLTTGSYANPSWVTSLVWSKITGTPTTLGGYGIATPLPFSAIPTGTTNTTVAVGNDTRFPSNVTGLRKGSGLASLDVAATPNTDYVTPDAAGRIALSLVPGVNVQVYDADLTSLSAFTSTGIIPYRSAADTWAAVTIGAGLTFTGGQLSATVTGGAGDVFSNVTTSLTGAAAVFADINGKIITPATGNGIATLANGVLGTTNTVISTQGGTGLNTVTTGEIIYGSSLNTFSRLAPNPSFSPSKYLRSISGTAPSWIQIPFSDLASTPTSLSGYGITNALVTTNNLSDLTAPSTARTNLGLAISGTSATGDVEAWDADLASIAALGTTNVIPYRSGAGTWGTVNISTGLTFTGGTLTATGSGDVVSNTNASLEGEVALFGPLNNGKQIKRSNTLGTGLAKLTSGVMAVGTANVDYAVNGEGAFTDGGTSGTPQAWSVTPIPKTVMSESVALATVDRYRALPPANAYAPGTVITYIDAKTVLNFGGIFRPAGLSDTLNGLTATAWGANGVRPFIGGGYGSKSSTTYFKTDGVSAWIQLQTGQVYAFVSPTDASARVLLDMSNTTTGTDYTFAPGGTPTSPNTVSVVPFTVNTGNYVTGIDSTGTATQDALPVGGGASIQPFGIPLSETGGIVAWPWDSTVTEQNQRVTLTAADTLNISNPVNGMHFTLTVTQDSVGGRTLALPYNSLTPSGGSGAIILSSAPNAIDTLSGYYDGTNFHFRSVLNETGPTFIVNEGAEGSGTPAGWTDTNFAAASSWDYTTSPAPIGVGTQSLKVTFSTTGANTVYTFGSGLSDVYVKARLRMISVGSYSTVIGLRNGSTVESGLRVSGTHIDLFTNGTASADSNATPSLTVNYYVWLEFHKNGTCVLAMSGTNVKPGPGGDTVGTGANVYLTQTGSGNTVNQLLLNAGLTGCNFIFDDIQASTVAIP